MKRIAGLTLAALMAFGGASAVVAATGSNAHGFSLPPLPGSAHSCDGIFRAISKDEQALATYEAQRDAIIAQINENPGTPAQIRKLNNTLQRTDATIRVLELTIQGLEFQAETMGCGSP